VPAPDRCHESKPAASRSRAAILASMDSAIRYLFVYGTLRPSLAGDEQRRLIAGLPDAGPATVPGLLYDLGPYPGMVAGEGTVHGDLLEVADECHLAMLDAYEECHGDDPLYRRQATLATRPDGTTVAAWSYLYCQPPGRSRIIESGDYSVAKQSPGGPPNGG
jgi:gamma-glutamylcyclotransferase (GGCT)/AIG2-like uncharacterized protein YtfP